MGATIGGETLLHATVSLDFPLQFHFSFLFVAGSLNMYE